MNVSIVVPAHNEAANIGQLLDSILAQKTRLAHVIEVVVVASGCTDETAEIARTMSQGRPGVHVRVQERREGKVAAINEYLRVRDRRAEIVVSCSADVRVDSDVVERIARYFRDNPRVGLVGARPVPDNDPNDLVGRMVCVLWELHHEVALSRPKMGEVIAFRAELIEYVSELSVVDEASVEDIVTSKGYEIGYLPEAVIRNHGPETLREYFEQRRRIARGHYWLSFAFGYKVATLDRGLLLRSAVALFRREDGFGRKAIAAAVATEVAARVAGFIDARIVGGKHRTWTPLASTKTLTTQAPTVVATASSNGRKS
jgi:cellulose synthase/poly-beta-1,6-N-acetylglucosamine synthase-like glycosyltransferase